MHNRMTKMINGCIILKRDIPADLSAAISYFSARLPIVIIEDSNTANGILLGKLEIKL